MDLGPTDFEGIASDILLDPTAYDEICEAYDNGNAADELSRAYLCFAVTLCHEISHAVHFARFSGRKIGFEDQLFSEDGFDWENTVFGGLVSGSGSQLWMTDWPSRRKCECYLRLGIFVHSLPSTEVEVDHFWRVPDAYVRKVFSKAFWSKVVAEPADTDALKVPKLLGYRVIPVGPQGCCNCVNCRTEEFYAQLLVRSGNTAKDDAMRGEIKAFWDAADREYSGWTIEEIHELPCDRNGWYPWPWRSHHTRKRG